MAVAALLLLASGAYPLCRAWQGNRRTSLLQAVHWASAAWLAWTGCALLAVTTAGTIPPSVRYVALCLTGCAGVAVLGARRPGVHAWNFVVLALLAVMLLPLVENLLPGAPLMDALRVVFLAGALGVGIVNYIPTRLALAISFLALGCTWEMLALARPDGPLAQWSTTGSPGWLLVGLAPWTGYLAWQRLAWPAAEFPRLWLDFRNRFGLFWGQRVREQFNNAAHHAGWPARLFWQGLVLTHTIPSSFDDVTVEMTKALRALLKRFVDDEQLLRE